MNKGLHIVAFILVVVGGINWLLVGLTGWDIGQIFGGMDALLSRIIYILVGVAAVYLAATHKKHCQACGMSSTTTGPAPMNKPM